MEADQARLAVALETTELGSVLVTHAGLTRQKWDAVGRPATARETVGVLNAELVGDPDAAFRAGEMVGALTEGPVGVVWASPAELLSSWDGHELPFSQVYGHASPFHWMRQTWDLRLAKRYTERGSADATSHRVEFEWPGGGRLVCVDPSYGTKNAAVPLVPFVLDGSVADVADPLTRRSMSAEDSATDIVAARSTVGPEILGWPSEASIAVLAAFRDVYSDVDPRLIASWAMTAQPELEGLSPTIWIGGGGPIEPVILAAQRAAAALAQ
jgi:hypothetical protein